MEKLQNDERGMIIVEAAYVFPVIIIITILLYFTSMYLAYRTNIQTSIEAALSTVSYTYGDTNISLSAKAGEETTYVPKLVNPYRRLTFWSNGDLEEQFERQATKWARYYFLPGGEKMELQVNSVNLIVYHELRASGAKTFRPPINMSFLGLPSELRLSTSARKMVEDQDEFIRTTDIGLDLVHIVDEKYGISDKISGFLEPARKLFKMLTGYSENA